MKFIFDTGTPEFQVVPQPTAHFKYDTGLGQPTDLAGSAGVLIVLKGFRGDAINYKGPVSFDASGAVLKEVQAIGGSEGQVSWAAGLSRPGCASVTAAGSTLTFHFVPSP